VRAVRCDHRASQAEVEAALQRATAPLSRSWDRLEGARRIAIKANVVLEPERIRCVDGRRQELVDDTVLRALLKQLRERTRAELTLVDSTYHPEGPRASYDIHFLPLLEELGVRYVECTHRDLEWYDVPGGGRLFRRYQLNPSFREADAMVSVATLKSHAFMGVTLSTKNLFGLCPVHPANRPRQYFHHLVRLPYVLADLGRTLNPCLNVIDGLVGQTGREWGGDARVADLLVAGDQCIATDACAATLMGHDPGADWGTPPFRRDRNTLRVAAEGGFGTTDLREIDFDSEVGPHTEAFDSDATDPSEMVASWRRTTCEQGLYYADHRDELMSRYPNEYVFLQGGEVVWHGPAHPTNVSRRQLAGARKDSALWLKYLDPEDREAERFEVYARELDRAPEEPALVTA
jgi:uncharacterized protein (DUF362 family)